MVRVFAGMALVIVAVPAAANDANPAPKKEPMVCRTAATTGSRLTSRTCHSKAEWTALDQATYAASDHALEADRIPQSRPSDSNGLVSLGGGPRY
jgi:hypothetical protein